MYLNKALIVGNITRDIELKSLPSGQKVASFSIATNLVYKDASGQKKETVDYHNIVVFGKQAEMCAQYLIKGQKVMIEGRITTRSWDKDGAKHYRTEILADRVQFGPKPQGSAQQYDGRDDTGFNTAEEVKEEKPAVTPKGYDGPIDYPDNEINIEDIPF